MHCYRQAERLDPTNANVQAGLAQVGTLLGKHATPPAAWSNPANIRRWLGPWPTVIVGLATFALGWTLMVFSWRARWRWLLIPAAPIVLCGLVVTSCVAWHGWQAEHWPAGVIAEATALREGNGSNFRAVVDHELPAGAEFRTLVQRDEWVRVRLADGTRGWVQRGQVLLVAPNSATPRLEDSPWGVVHSSKPTSEAPPSSNRIVSERTASFRFTFDWPARRSSKTIGVSLNRQPTFRQRYSISS